MACDQSATGDGTLGSAKLGINPLLVSTPSVVANLSPVDSLPTSTALPTDTAIPTSTTIPTNTSLPTSTTLPEPTITPQALIAPSPTLELPLPTKFPTARPVAVSPTPPAKATTRPPLPATTVPVKPTVPVTVRPTIATAPYTGALSEVVRGRTGQKRVALTLDAGSGAAPFPKILAALNKAGVKVTFFLTGAWAQQNPTYVQQMVSSGDELGNHTWDHPDLVGVSDAQIKDQIERTDALLSRFTGHTSRPLWRAPFGSRNARVMKVVNDLGFRSIFWTLDSLDSVGDPKSAKFLIDRITGQSNTQLDGEIILMHIGNATTADALPAIIENLQGRGFKIVTVSELLS